MLVDDKQAREKIVSSVVAWLRGQEWTGERPTRGESADAIESLSAQVAELKKDAARKLDIFGDHWAYCPRYDEFKEHKDGICNCGFDAAKDAT